MAKIDKTVLIFIIRLGVYIFVVFPMQFRPTTTIGDNISSVLAYVPIFACLCHLLSL